MGSRGATLTHGGQLAAYPIFKALLEGVGGMEPFGSMTGRENEPFTGGVRAQFLDDAQGLAGYAGSTWLSVFLRFRVGSDPQPLPWCGTHPIAASDKLRGADKGKTSMPIGEKRGGKEPRASFRRREALAMNAGRVSCIGWRVVPVLVERRDDPRWNGMFAAGLTEENPPMTAS